jgi:hypothetical protein
VLPVSSSLGKISEELSGCRNDDREAGRSERKRGVMTRERRERDSKASASVDKVESDSGVHVRYETVQSRATMRALAGILAQDACRRCVPHFGGEALAAAPRRAGGRIYYKLRGRRRHTAISNSRGCSGCASE